MSPLAAGLVGIIVFIIFLALRIPIAVAMGLTGFVGFSYLNSFASAMTMMVQDVFSTFNSYTLSVIPLFIWMGFLAYYSGVGGQFFSFAYKLCGHLPGGLAIASQLSCGVFGAVCGSSTATAATIGTIAIPEMRKYKYSDSLSTASVAAGGALGVLIPPSVIFVIYGIATEQAIGKLFMAGILPGILLILLYILVIWVITTRNPELGPAGAKAGRKEIFSSLKQGLPEILIVFLLSIGGLFTGLFTPSEAAAVGAFGMLMVTLLRRQLTRKGFNQSLLDTTRTTAMIMFLIAGAVIFGRFIAISRIPFELASWAGSLPLPSFMVMAIILLIYLVLGCFIDALALILLTTPIFYPVVVNLGYDPIWFGVIIVLVVAMGIITPPVGMNIFIIKGIAPDIPIEVIFRGIMPFLVAIVICIVILMVFPQVALFLPNILSN